MSTSLLIDLRTSDQSPGPNGVLLAELYERTATDTIVILPNPVRADLLRGVGSMSLPAGTYRFTEQCKGGVVRFCVVPDVSSYEYAAMPSVDPITLAPTAVPEAAWWAALAAAEIGGGGGTGPTGPQGPAGASAYQLAVAGGFVGNQAAWLASLHGANGTNGTNGTNGAAGAAGATGPTGPTGPAGLSVLVLGPSAPVPGGTPAGTPIFRTT